MSKIMSCIMVMILLINTTLVGIEEQASQGASCALAHTAQTFENLFRLGSAFIKFTLLLCTASAFGLTGYRFLQWYHVSKNECQEVKQVRQEHIDCAKKQEDVIATYHRNMVQQLAVLTEQEGSNAFEVLKSIKAGNRRTETLAVLTGEGFKAALDATAREGSHTRDLILDATAREGSHTRDLILDATAREGSHTRDSITAEHAATRKQEGEHYTSLLTKLTTIEQKLDDFSRRQPSSHPLPLTYGPQNPFLEKSTVARLLSLLNMLPS